MFQLERATALGGDQTVGGRTVGSGLGQPPLPVHLARRHQEHLLQPVRGQQEQRLGVLRPGERRGRCEVQLSSCDCH